MEKFKLNLDKYFEKLSRKSKESSPTQIMVISNKNQINYDYSSVKNDSPFHIASVGKMMTATVIGLLSDKGLLDVDGKACHYLSDEILTGLFVYKGNDYKNQITIQQLLSHTSGIADYFESKTNAGSSFVDKAMGEPSKVWKPQDLVDFTRNNQRANSAPGEFLYSDTGYILLGLIIEKVTDKAFHEVLLEYIFRPLGMNDSYLLFGGVPINEKRPICDVWFNGKEISKINMLSCDWAGGGVVSTTQDLLIFQNAFWGGGLVSDKFISNMSSCNNKFRSGMYYGSGMMELRLEGFFFLLMGFPRLYGHSGILGTLMFYDKTNDLHVIMNLGSNKRVVDSFKALISIETSLKRIYHTK